MPKTTARSGRLAARDRTAGILLVHVMSHDVSDSSQDIFSLCIRNDGGGGVLVFLGKRSAAFETAFNGQVGASYQKTPRKGALSQYLPKDAS